MPQAGEGRVAELGGWAGLVRSVVDPCMSLDVVRVCRTARLAGPHLVETTVVQAMAAVKVATAMALMAVANMGIEERLTLEAVPVT